ncbi:MAG: hypothetical protein IPH75_08570 [bacterium]|nr:hypothetical protein [bacterium]
MKNRHLTLCSSIGMQTWELVTALASMHRVPLRLYLPPKSPHSLSRSEISRQFALPNEGVEFVDVEYGGDSKEEQLACRDQAVVADADILIPIAVRSGGHMDSLLQAASREGKQVISDFLVHPTRDAETVALHVEAERINPEVDLLPRRYLIHWTRTPHGAWPRELHIDYYRALIQSTRFPRSAYETIRRIAGSRLLIGSPRHMPSNFPTVAFSALTPRDLIPLMKWRARYAELSFEPYGIGIREDIATELGILPVIYYDTTKPAEYEKWPWRCQSIGTKTDWRQEAESRYPGDLSLASLGPEALRLFCHTQAEAEKLSTEFGIPTTNLFLT